MLTYNKWKHKPSLSLISRWAGSRRHLLGKRDLLTSRELQGWNPGRAGGLWWSAGAHVRQANILWPFWERRDWSASHREGSKWHHEKTNGPRCRTHHTITGQGSSTGQFDEKLKQNKRCLWEESNTPRKRQERAREGSEVKMACCSRSGPEFCSNHPLAAAHSYCNSSHRGMWHSLLDPVGNWLHVHIPLLHTTFIHSYIYTYIHIYA